MRPCVSNEHSNQQKMSDILLANARMRRHTYTYVCTGPPTRIMHAGEPTIFVRYFVKYLTKVYVRYLPKVTYVQVHDAASVYVPRYIHRCASTCAQCTQGYICAQVLTQVHVRIRMQEAYVHVLAHSNSAKARMMGQRIRGSYQLTRCCQREAKLRMMIGQRIHAEALALAPLPKGRRGSC